MSTADARLRPRKHPRQERSRRTREEILAAAARIFGEFGYAAGTTNRIAEDAGISIGTLYQHFPNKDAILVELMRRHVHDGIAAVQERLAEASAGDTGRSVEDRLRPFVLAALDNHAGAGRLHQVLFEESPRPGPLLEELRALEGQAVDAVAALLRGDQRIRVRDERRAAWIVVATIESLVHRFVAGGRPFSEAAFADEVVAMVGGYLTGATDTGAGTP